MKNSLLDILTGKERKRYNDMVQLIEQKKYGALFVKITRKNGLSDEMRWHKY